MRSKQPQTPVKMAFEEEGLRIAITDINPLKTVDDSVRKTTKYIQIAASIREVGIVEPPIVTRDQNEKGKYLLLDGHLRVDVLKQLGKAEVACLISTDDEAFTYNKRINRLATVQEHRMIVKAIERGVSEDRIAKALNVNIPHIVLKRRLLEGICQKWPKFSRTSTLRSTHFLS